MPEESCISQAQATCFLNAGTNGKAYLTAISVLGVFVVSIKFPLLSTSSVELFLSGKLLPRAKTVNRIFETRKD